MFFDAARTAFGAQPATESEIGRKTLIYGFHLSLSLSSLLTCHFFQQASFARERVPCNSQSKHREDLLRLVAEEISADRDSLRGITVSSYPVGANAPFYPTSGAPQREVFESPAAPCHFLDVNLLLRRNVLSGSFPASFPAQVPSTLLSDGLVVRSRVNF